jgi:Arc/MetJ-type ribon-helix-helix transcriptional regulator
LANQKEIETVPVATRITKSMFKAVQTVLLSNAHLNVADYVRDLIRKDLEKRGVLDEKERWEGR